MNNQREFTIVEWKEGQPFGVPRKPAQPNRKLAENALAACFEYDYNNRDGAKAELQALTVSRGRMPRRLAAYNCLGKFYAVAPVIKGAYLTPFASKEYQTNRTSEDLLL